MNQKIDLEDVVSSNLAAIGYNPTKQILAVQFKSGHIHHYAGVDVLVAAGFNDAESKGRYYAANIKGKYQAARMTGHCEKCGDGPGWIGDPCGDCGTAVYLADPIKGEEHSNGQANGGQDPGNSRGGAPAPGGDQGRAARANKPGSRGDQPLSGKVPRGARGGGSTKRAR